MQNNLPRVVKRTRIETSAHAHTLLVHVPGFCRLRMGFEKVSELAVFCNTVIG